MSSYQNCALCGGDNIEKFSDTNFLCRDCGLGTDGKAKNFDEHLEFLKKSVKLAKMMFPEMTPEELSNKVQTTLHKVENHPVRQDGYCEFCDKKYGDN